MIQDEQFRAQGWTMIEQAAQGGDALAMIELADKYRTGKHGTTVDMTRAQTWLERAAATSHDFALMRLGQSYLMGDCFPG